MSKKPPKKKKKKQHYFKILGCFEFFFGQDVTICSPPLPPPNKITLVITIPNVITNTEFLHPKHTLQKYQYVCGIVYIGKQKKERLHNNNM
jgi:hypothetical protein